MKSIFQKLIRENKLAHSYIFFGQNAAGLSELANWLVNFLENTKLTPSQGVNFDALFIQPKENSIGIDQVRTIKSFLWQKPIQSPKRTVIINSAQFLTTEAQNAILKIAEEPPAHALIILLVNDPQILLATLTSRFQKFFIADNSFPQTQGLTVNLSIKKYVSDFLKGDMRLRRQIIKDVLEQSLADDDSSLSDFIKLLMLELDKNPVKNWRALKELLHRWQLINQYNVNKRLQLEIVAQQC